MIAGSIFMFAGSTAPSGYLMCDGSAVSRTTYSNLFAAIGTRYGTGDGSTTFNLPDLSGRVAVGTSVLDLLGATGGEASHALQDSEMPLHAHSLPAHTHGNNVSATTPAMSHSVTTEDEAKYRYPKYPSTAEFRWASNGTSTYIRSRKNAASTSSFSISDHPASACSVSCTISACAAHDSTTAGGGAAHSNMQPYITMNYVICTGVE